ncbi:MAG: cation:proton antiporter [Thiotrichales bacterium]
MATSVLSVLLFFLAMLVVALLLEPVATRWRLPYPALLVLVGFAGSEALVAAGIDTGLRWDGFRDLVFYVLLPLLVFEAALRIEIEDLLADWLAILLLALPLLLVAVGITAAVLYFGIAHPTGFPWVAALLAGAVLSATDPGAVLAQLRRLPQLGRLGNILQGESLFNDALAIVLFAVLVAMATDAERVPGFGAATLNILVIFSGGVLLGGGLGFIARRLWQWLGAAPQRGALMLACALGGYWLAEGVFKVSGVMAVLVAGLLLNARVREAAQPERQALLALWRHHAFVADALLFVLLGITLRLALLTEQWIAVLLGIGAVLTARAVVIYAGLWLAGKLGRAPALPMNERTLAFLGGARGATTVALILSLPAGLSYDYTLQAIVYGVVLFTLFVQAPLVLRYSAK